MPPGPSIPADPAEQFSSLTQINTNNVKQLEVVWIYATGEKGTYLFNPLIVWNRTAA
jgi:hypothetical protein